MRHYIQRGELIGMFHVGRYGAGPTLERDALEWDLVTDARIVPDVHFTYLLEFEAVMCGYSEGAYKQGDFPDIPQHIMDAYSDPTIPISMVDNTLRQPPNLEFVGGRPHPGRLIKFSYDPLELDESPSVLDVLFISPKVFSLNHCIINLR